MEDTGLIQYGTHKNPAFFSLISSNDSEFWKRSAKPVLKLSQKIAKSTYCSILEYYSLVPRPALTNSIFEQIKQTVTGHKR